MTSYEKVIKLACKPKAAPPKAKYIDTIIAATYSEDGAVHDVCKSLAPKFKEPNAIIVFKALIVLHTMVRNGATDNVLGYLSQSDVLRLRNVSNGQWEGYTTPQNLSNYAHYLDFRIRAYKDLKHDPIRVQSETNRDLRVGGISTVDEDGRRGSLGNGGGGSSSSASNLNKRQTIVGRKLRIMTVEKGLLRETKIVQKMIDSLLACKFYLDDLEDELTITALRILVKDLLVLFQACNEGVINLLENYFEMAHTDASAALTLYRHFCTQTENVVEYLTIARKLENLLNVPIPSLKHAPVSLAGSLEEYLRDPNFEQNRIEYKTNKEAADRGLKEGKRSVKRTEPARKADSPVPPVPTKPATETPSTSMSPPKKEVNKELADFFASIEPDQPNLFNQRTASPIGPSGFNPFTQQQQQPFGAPVAMNPFPGAGPSPFINVQPTGMFANNSPFGPGIQAQGTGFPPGGGMQSSATFPAGFGGAQPTGAPFLSPNFTGAPNGNSPFARPASAGPNFAANGAGAGAMGGAGGGGGFLQPQMTGANPFRQSIVAPQATGLPFGGFGANGPFGGGGGGGGAPAFSNGTTNGPFNLQPQQMGAPPATAPPFALPSSAPFGGSSATNNEHTTASPFAIPASNSNGDFTNNNNNANKIIPPFARPASTPITGSGDGGVKPLTSQMTGSRNPFGRPKSPPPPPVPPVPTLGQLAAERFGAAAGAGASAFGAGSSPFGMFGSGNAGGAGAGVFGAGAVGQNGNAGGTGNGTGTAPNVGMSSVASEFAFNKPSTSTSSGNLNGNASTTADLFGSSPFGALFAQTTSNSSSTAPSSSFFSGFSATPTGSSTATSTPSLKPQQTGFGGSAVRPFKPASSFGASLWETLPTIPQGAPLSTSPPPLTNNNTNGTSGVNGIGAQPTGFGGFGGLGAASTNATNNNNASNPGMANGLASQPTGFGGFGGFGSSSTTANSTSPSGGTNGIGAESTGFSGLGAFGGGGGVGPGTGPRSNGLSPQMTGGNPFRASMFDATGGASNGGAPQLPSMPTGFGFGSSLFPTTTGVGGGGGSSYGANLFGNAAGGAANGPSPTSTMPGAFPGFGAPQQQQQQQPQSLI